MKKINLAFDYLALFYKGICVYGVTTVLLLLAVFGGDFHISINFNSLMELLNHFK